MWTSAGRSIRRAAGAALLLLLGAAGLGAQEEQTAFNWAFVKRAPDGSPAPIDFKERVSIAPKDLFKIHVQPLRGAFVYLFLHDAQGELEMLFPTGFELFSSPGYLDTRYFIPAGDDWFTLDGAGGTERFYLLASGERLRALESLVRAYLKASAGAKGAARQAVLDEIARLRREHSKLTVAAEKPVTIAGGTRGVNTAIQNVATRIEAPGFYYKLFRLEH